MKQLSTYRKPAAFSRVYPGNSKNFMTPNVLGYWKGKIYVAELSTGRGITQQEIFGVTLVYLPGKPAQNGCQLFQSEQAALAYIESLEDEETE